MRSLIYIPIIHNVADLGTVAEALRTEYLENFDERRWQDHLEAIDEVWSVIRRTVESLPLNHHKVKLYQDGLPVCDNEIEIVRQAATEGSQNHQILLEMIDKGARLVGTEDPVLLLEEYRIIREMAEASDAEGKDQIADRYREVSASLLEKRDAFIARRIDETLKSGETGLLFIGLIHKVDEILPNDMRVQYLFNRWTKEQGVEEGGPKAAKKARFLSGGEEKLEDDD